MEEAVFKQLSQLPGVEVITPSGNKPIWADDPKVVYVLVSGRLDLFLAPKLASGRPGSRYALSTLDSTRPGAALLGGAPFEGYSLLACGSPGCKVLRMGFDQLREYVQAGDQVDAIVSWVYQLSAWVRRMKIPGDTKGYNPETDMEFFEGDRFNASKKLIWVDSPEGKLEFFEGLKLEIPNSLIFPVSRSVWVKANGRSKVKFLTTAEAVETKKAWEGLLKLQELTMRVAVWQALKYVREVDARILGRDEANARIMADSLAEMAVVLPGTTIPWVSGAASSDDLFEACALVGKNALIKIARPISGGANISDPITAIADSSRCRVRRIYLRDTWYKTDSGPILGAWEDGRPVALIPTGQGRYDAVDPKTRAKRRVTAAVARELNVDAYCFYRPLPDHSLGLFDLVKFCAPVFVKDLWVVFYVGIASGILNLAMPIGTGMLVSQIIPSGVIPEVKTLALVLLVATLANQGFQVVRALTLQHLEGRMDGLLQSALMDRLVNLPAPFFRDYSTGDLSSRVLGINAIRKVLSGAGLTSLLGGLFSIFSFMLLFYYSWMLALVACLLVAFNFGVLFVASAMQIGWQREQLDVAGRISGKVFQYLTGINKLRVAGAEARAFQQWADDFSAQRRISFHLGMVGANLGCFSSFYSIFTSVVMYGLFAHWGYKGLSTGDFLSFFSAFGQFMGAISGIGGSLNSILSIGPTLDRAKPILREPLEVATHRPEPAPLEGRVEMNHISFRYRADGEFILQDVNIEAEPGEFIAVVGPSGAGKSTILRMLLGFESPEKGTVLYDGQNIQSINTQALRRQVGVVLQNSQLMAGDILGNIVGSSLLTEKDAWEAAELAGMTDEIKRLPMGMHTVVMEGSAGFSGGQRQRLLIARAVVAKPRVLFFDEATSALDSETQESVSRGLERLQSTRVVIAHRLSTIRSANRIYVMSNRTVAQVGNYDELIAVPGVFQDLAKRQLV